MIRRLPLNILLLLLALTCGGCSTLDLNLPAAWGRGDSSRRAPSELIALWEAAEGVGLDNLPTRGFAGRIMFFVRGRDEPVPVTGDVRIYVFDNQGTEEEQARPLHQFEFPPEVWNTYLRETNLGPSYQVFIPYTRKGGDAADCALRIRVLQENQPPLYSKMANVALAGRRVKSTQFTPGAMDELQRAFLETAHAGGEPDRGESAGHLMGAETFAIPQTAALQRLERAARGAVQTADYSEPAEADEDIETESSPSRPHRFAIQAANSETTRSM